MLLGNIFQQASDAHRRGNLPEAERLCRQLITLAPQEDAGRIMLGVLKQQQGLFDEALGVLDGARNKDAVFWTKRGNVLVAMQRGEEAEAAYRRALKLDAKAPEALLNRALLRFNDGRHAEALADYDAGLAVAPAYADGHNNRGWCLLNLRRLPEAFAAFENALAVNPNLAGARLNQGVWHLLQGNYAAGLPLYEFRKRLPQPVEQRVYPQPLWTGREEIAGTHVFLYLEQGLGDAVQYFRFVDLLLAKGAQLTLAAPRPVLPLLQAAGRPVRLIDLNTPPGAVRFSYPADEPAVGAGPAAGDDANAHAVSGRRTGAPGVLARKTGRGLPHRHRLAGCGGARRGGQGCTAGDVRSARHPSRRDAFLSAKSGRRGCASGLADAAAGAGCGQAFPRHCGGHRQPRSRHHRRHGDRASGGRAGRAGLAGAETCPQLALDARSHGFALVSHRPSLPSV
jgi:Flp pilus assembly protein TadD